MAGYEIRVAPSGKVIQGNTGDVLVYSAEDQLWFPGPVGGELPPGTEVDQVLTWQPDTEDYQPKGRIASYIIAKVADVQTLFPAVDGVHTVSDGLVEFQSGLFDLGANRIAITGSARVTGWGATETTITSTHADGTVTVTAPGVTLDSLHLRNTGNGNSAAALEVDIEAVAGVQQETVLTACALGTLVQDDPWSSPARVTDGSLRLENCTIGDAGVRLVGSGASFVMHGGKFVLNNVSEYGVTCQQPPTRVELRDVQFIGSRAGMVAFGEAAEVATLDIQGCSEGYTGSLGGFAVLSQTSLGAIANVRIINNVFAGAIGLEQGQYSSVQITDNWFGGHQAERPSVFPYLSETFPGVCLRDNYDVDLEGYLPETPEINRSYAFSSAAELEIEFPAVGGVHTLNEYATYTIMGAGFDLGGNSIQLTRGTLKGQLRSLTVLTSDVDGPVLSVTNDPNNRVEGLTVENTGDDSLSVAFEMYTAATARDCKFIGPDAGSAVSLRAGTLDDCTFEGSTVAQVLRPDTTNDATLNNCKFGFGSGDMVRVLATGTTTLVGCSYARNQVGTHTNFVSVLAASDTNQQLYLQNNDIGNRAVVWAAGQQSHYAAIQGNNLGAIVLATADVPAGGLSLTGNKLINGAYTGFAETDARVMCRANFAATSALNDTPIVT